MVALLVDGQVFTGDTLFKGSVGGVRAPGSTSYEDLKESIMGTLVKLPPETIVRPGHTDPTTIGDELENNAFIRVWRGPGPRGRRAVHRARRARDARPVRRRLRRRAQGLGPLARRPRRHRPRLAGPAPGLTGALVPDPERARAARTPDEPASDDEALGGAAAAHGRARPARRDRGGEVRRARRPRTSGARPTTRPTRSGAGRSTPRARSCACWGR